MFPSAFKKKLNFHFPFQFPPLFSHPFHSVFFSFLVAFHIQKKLLLSHTFSCLNTPPFFSSSRVAFHNKKKNYFSVTLSIVSTFFSLPVPFTIYSHLPLFSHTFCCPQHSPFLKKFPGCLHH